MCEEHHDSAEPQAVPLGPSEHDVSRKVREFYEEFRFPTVRPPAQDGLILMRRLDRSMGRSRSNASTMRVLDAGCGKWGINDDEPFRLKNKLSIGLDASFEALRERCTTRNPMKRNS